MQAMSKQKKWFVVFLAMFLLPEILWGGVIGKIVYYWVLNNSVKGGVSNFSLLSIPSSFIFKKTIYLIEFVGVSASLVCSITYYHPKYKLLKLALIISLGLLLLAAFYYVLFASHFSNISIG